MPQCIFCNRPTSTEIYQGSNRSLCLDCVVEVRRFEYENREEIVRRILPDNMIAALRRLKTSDPKQFADDPAKEAQMHRDLDIINKSLPY